MNTTARDGRARGARAQMAETTRTMRSALPTGATAMASDDTMSRSEPIRPKSRATRKARIDL